MRTLTLYHNCVVFDSVTQSFLFCRRWHILHQTSDLERSVLHNTAAHIKSDLVLFLKQIDVTSLGLLQSLFNSRSYNVVHIRLLMTWVSWEAVFWSDKPVLTCCILFWYHSFPVWSSHFHVSGSVMCLQPVADIFCFHSPPT